MCSTVQFDSYSERVCALILTYPAVFAGGTGTESLIWTNSKLSFTFLML